MSNSTEFKHIDVVGLKALQEQGDVRVFDIRDPQSYALGHIPQALPLNNDNLQASLDATDKSSPVVICCYHGISSQQAAQFVASQGFSDVYSLDGGYEAWRQSEQ